MCRRIPANGSIFDRAVFIPITLTEKLAAVPTVAVELHLVQPILSLWQAVAQGRFAGRDEGGDVHLVGLIALPNAAGRWNTLS